MTSSEKLLDNQIQNSKKALAKSSSLTSKMLDKIRNKNKKEVTENV